MLRHHLPVTGAVVGFLRGHFWPDTRQTVTIPASHLYPEIATRAELGPELMLFLCAESGTVVVPTQTALIASAIVTRKQLGHSRQGLETLLVHRRHHITRQNRSASACCGLLKVDIFEDITSAQVRLSGSLG